MWHFVQKVVRQHYLSESRQCDCLTLLIGVKEILPFLSVGKIQCQISACNAVKKLSVSNEMQCTYNVTLQHVHELKVTWKNNKHNILLCVCVRVWVRARARVAGDCKHMRACGCGSTGVCFSACSLTYTAYNAHAPYFLRPVWLHHIFRHCVIKSTLFGKLLPNIKRMFWFFLQLLFETFLILRRNLQDIVMNVM